MAIGYIPKKSDTGAIINVTELPEGRLNLGGEIPALSTLSSEIVIDDLVTWNASLFTLNCLNSNVKATIYWDYGGDDIILFHSDIPFTFRDDVYLTGDGVKILRLEIKNLDVLNTQKASLTIKYDVVS